MSNSSFEASEILFQYRQVLFSVSGYSIISMRVATFRSSLYSGVHIYKFIGVSLLWLKNINVPFSSCTNIKMQ